MIEQKMKRVGIYVRVSTPLQDIKGTSIPSQIESLKHYIESKKSSGWELKEIYREGGVSGAKDERPELGRLREDVESGRLDIILVMKIDRLYRKTEYLLSFVRFLEEHNVEFVCSEDNIDTSKTGKFLLTVLGAIAEMERETIAERTIMGKIKKAKDGKYVGSGVPYGYRVSEDKELVTNPYEVEIVKKIFDMYVKKGKSQQAIADELTSLGVPVRGDSLKDKRKNEKNKGKWLQSTVGDILGYTHYIGKYYYNRYVYEKNRRVGEKPQKEWIPFTCEAIIEESIFQRAQEMKKLNKANAKPVGKGRYLLAGLIRCGECGYSFQGYPASKKPNTYYRCKGRYDKKTDCKIKQISGQVVESLVWGLVTDMIGNPKNFANYLQNKKDTNKVLKKYKKELGELIKQKEKLETEIGNLLEDRIGGEITRKIAELKIEEKEKRATHITELIKEKHQLIASEESKQDLEQSVEKISEAYSKKIEYMTQEDKHKLLTILIAKILVFENKVEVYFKFNINKPKVMKVSGKKKGGNQKLAKNNYSSCMYDHGHFIFLSCRESLINKGKVGVQTCFFSLIGIHSGNMFFRSFFLFSNTHQHLLTELDIQDEKLIQELNLDNLRLNKDSSSDIVSKI